MFSPRFLIVMVLTLLLSSNNNCTDHKNRKHADVFVGSDASIHSSEDPRDPDMQTTDASENRTTETHENISTIHPLDIQHLYTSASNDIRGKDLEINTIDRQGFTPLYEAAMHNDLAEVTRLLRLGANPNIWGRKMIPLHVAFRNKNSELIQLLLDNGAVVIDKKFGGLDILSNLSLNSDPVIQEIILNHFSGQPSKTNGDQAIFGKDLPINAVDHLGYTALYHAIMDHDLSEVEILLRSGANPNIWSRQKIPLNAAVIYGKKDVVQLLLNNGAVIVDKEISKRDILNRPSKNYPAIHTLLLDHLSSKRATHKSYKDLHDPEIDINTNQNLHDPEVDINAVDNSGCTVLYRAVYRRDLSEVKRLLTLGADPNIGGDDYLYSPLGSAVLHIDQPMVQLLLEYGAEVIFESESKSRMLSTACIKNKEILSMLLCRVASTGRKDDVFGSTPLHWACRDGYLKVVEHIFATDPTADVNDIDPTYNFTPLHWAAMRGHKEIVDFLLSKGANKRAKSKHGFTPLMLAISNEHNGLRACLSPDGFDRQMKNFYADWTCTICLEGLEESRYKAFPMVPLSCGHKFHMPCIVQSILIQAKGTLEKNCPNCRTQVSDEMINAIKVASKMPFFSLFSVYLAVSKNDPVKLKVLLEQGGNVHDLGLTKRSPLIQAILDEHYDLVPLLLQYGSDVNYTTPDALNTALHVAAMGTYTTPTMHAAAQANIINLIQYGAVVNLKNVNCKTPVDLCHIDDIVLFFEAGGIRSGSFDDIQHAFDLGGSEVKCKILYDRYKTQK